MSGPDWAQEAADALDALGDSPTPAEARAVTDRFEDTDLMAAIVSRGGGGGGLPDPITDPVTIDSSDVTDPALTVKSEMGAQYTVLQVLVPGSATPVFAVGQDGAVNVQPGAGLGATQGISVDSVTGGPSFGLLRVTVDGNHIFRVDDTGDVFGNGGCRMPNLPTSDPGVAGALWVDNAADHVVKQSQG